MKLWQALALIALSFVWVVGSGGSFVATAAPLRYSPRQQLVIQMICDACGRRQVDCTRPLALARRESQFGLVVESQVDRANGRALSVGVFQWHEAGLGGYRGPGYEDDWRWDLARDIERGVELTTSDLRGGPSYMRHWWSPAGLDTRDLPVCESGRRGQAADAQAVRQAAQGDGPPDGDGLTRGEGDR